MAASITGRTSRMVTAVVVSGEAQSVTVCTTTKARICMTACNIYQGPNQSYSSTLRLGLRVVVERHLKAIGSLVGSPLLH